MDFKLGRHLIHSQLQRNRSLYRPTQIVGAILTALIYIVFTMTDIVEHSSFSGGRSMASILRTMSCVLCLMAIFVFFYLNSLLMKLRQRYYGLYAVLGMSGTQVQQLSFLELTWLSLRLLGGGLLLGTLGAYMVFQLVLLIMRDAAVFLQFRFSVQALLETVLLLLLLYCLLLLYNALAIRHLSILDMLQAEQCGEREPRAQPLLAFISLLLLGGAYYFANCPMDPITAISIFPMAVIAVILGTYGLFIALSVWLLKGLKHFRGLYYRPHPFFSISSLLFRMKANGASLATISILFTCAFLTFSTTMTLYLGMEQSILSTNPEDAASLLQEMHMVFGSLLFLGFYFICFFLISSTLIIYFKQVSEAHTDRPRIVTMQELGISAREIQSLIRRQLLLMFLLPLFFAVLNVLGSWRILWTFLEAGTERALQPTFFLQVSAISVLIFSLFYLLVYAATSRVYFRIVRREQS